MNFNVDRIAQLAGLSSAGGGSASGSLNESASRRARPATTYDRVVEELQVRGLEMFYAPAQINEAIRTERRLIAEEKHMEDEGSCPSCGKSPCQCDESYDMDEAEHHLKMASEEMDDEGMHAEDEAYSAQPGDKITTKSGDEFLVNKVGTRQPTRVTESSLAEAKLRKVISAEVDKVLAEMSNSGDTAWMYADRKRPTTRTKGATMGFAGVGFKR
jgi:hypothetical protein